MLKWHSRPKGDHVTYFWGWIERPIAQSSVSKCSYANDTIEGGFMMWMSPVMDGNKLAKYQLPIKHKALKWVKTNNTPPTKKIYSMLEQKWWVVWCFHLLYKVLKIWPFLTPN